MRLVRRAAASLLALLLAVVGTGYVLSERILRRTYDAPLGAVAVPSDSVSRAEGQRLPRTRGCYSCHGAALTGKVFKGEATFARFVAPNLTERLPTYSDAELVRLMRTGVQRDGTSLFGMPVQMLHGLSDADMGRLLAFLRTVPPAEGLAYVRAPGWRGRWALLRGDARPEVQKAAKGPSPPHPPPGDTLALGRYVAHSACGCHGPKLQGLKDAPPLTIAAAYSDSAFVRLMRTGVPLDGGALAPRMKAAAQERFVHLTDAEVRALHAYLRTLAAAS